MEGFHVEKICFSLHGQQEQEKIIGSESLYNAKQRVFPESNHGCQVSRHLLERNSNKGGFSALLRNYGF